MKSRVRTALAVAAAGALLASCAEGGVGPAEQSTDHFGYQLPNDVTTTNAGSMVGASQMAQALSGRLYPGVFVPGPSGQMIPNTDLATTQVLPGAQRRVVYTLSDAASFSDGTPVTCADYLLTYKAGQLPEVFGSHMPLFSEVESLSCQPGSKEFTLVFKEGAGARWRGLFGAGTVLPSHAVARRAGIDPGQVVDLLNAGDAEQLRPLAEAWRDGFNLDSFDPATQVSFGPYRVDSVGESGEVTLVANGSYYGDAPRTPKLAVWPASADPAELESSGALRVAELAEPAPAWLDLNAEGNAFDVSSVLGELTDSLTFAPAGIWASAANRKALSACVDPAAVAAASGAASGMEVPVNAVHVVAANDPLARRFGDIVDPHLPVDNAAASALAGVEVRIGYVGTSPRMAAMVEAIRASCAPAGVSVVDAGGGKTLRDLTHLETGEWGEQVTVDGSIDAILRPVDATTEYTGPGNRSQDLAALREEEKKLWEELASIPLSVQPRSFAVDRNVGNVVVYTGTAGIGWNMDRWQSATPQPSNANGSK
ncbi:ABC transporter substrate-binding protein [uncultured Corynebacterium sp.]|uniref:ABC transporter substrate-binding protein n=1 Tax=uncultured Corynebacterium sp. TaxID=159447 RepID=UPI002598A58E|nr:ABC transporter substrate-binding protein [uncultured Corynebacterium sp.]